MKVHTYTPRVSMSCDALRDVQTVLKTYIHQNVNVDVNIRALRIIEYEYFKQCIFKEIPIRSQDI